MSKVKEELEFSLNEYQNFLKEYNFKLKQLLDENLDDFKDIKPLRNKNLKLIGLTSKTLQDKSLKYTTSYKNDFKNKNLEYFKNIQDEIKSALSLCVKEICELEIDKIEFFLGKFDEAFTSLSALVFKNIALDEKDLNVALNINKLISLYKID
jgi:hypothetical protein